MSSQKIAIPVVAGRELDCAIAERVVGIEPRDVRIRGETNSVRMWTENRFWKDGENPRNRLEQYAGPKPYSADIAFAWKVHVKMCEEIFSTRLRYFRELQKIASQGLDVTVAWPDVLMILRNRMPEAICLAAIRAIEERPTYTNPRLPSEPRYADGSKAPQPTEKAIPSSVVPSVVGDE